MNPDTAAKKPNTVPIGTLANLPPVIDGLGFDGWAFMQNFGLTPNSFIRPLQPIPIALCGEILHRAVACTGREELPLLLGSRARMENVGPLRLLIASSTRVREAIDALIRFRRIWYSGFQIAIATEGGMASLAIDVSGSFVGHQAVRTTYLTAMVRHVEAIVGPPWQIRELHLSRPAPADTRPYREQFGILPAFGQLRDAVFFDARLLDIKRPAAPETELNAFLRRQLTTMEAALGSDFADQISDLIETLLMGGGCSVEKVADVLGMHRQTLYRRLQEQRIAFETLLDNKRKALAEGMLLRNTMPVAEIAEALGYSSPANFTRAFRRWNGTSPSAWCRQRSAPQAATT